MKDLLKIIGIILLFSILILLIIKLYQIRVSKVGNQRATSIQLSK